MSNIKELSPKEGIDLLFVDIPVNTTEVEVRKHTVEGFKDTGGMYFYRDLPPGRNYTKLGIATELSEEVVRELVFAHMSNRQEECEAGIVYEYGLGYYDYESKTVNLSTALESFASLLRAHNISERSLVLRANK